MINDYIDLLVVVTNKLADLDPLFIIKNGGDKKDYLNQASYVARFIINSRNFSEIDLADVIQKVFYRYYNTYLSIPCTIQIARGIISNL